MHIHILNHWAFSTLKAHDWYKKAHCNTATEMHHNTGCIKNDINQYVKDQV